MAEQKDLKSVLKDIQKKYGDSVVKFGVDELVVDGVLSLGSPSVDFCTYGGIPVGRIIELSGAEGSGKAQPLSSPIFTPDGYIKMGDVKVGDIVVDGRGQKTTVTGVYPRGELPTYRVIFNDGTSTICAGDHLWKVYHHPYGRKSAVKVLDTETLAAAQLHQGCWAYSVDVPTLDLWEDEGINIHPYLLGCLIGDGSLKGNFSFTNSEKDVLEKVDKMLSAYHYHLSRKPGSKYDYYIKRDEECDIKYHYFLDGVRCSSAEEVVRRLRSEGYKDLWKLIVKYKKGEVDLFERYPELSSRLSITKNEHFFNRSDEGTLYSDLDNYGLLCRSVDKHIPTNYLFSSYETRVELMNGLYDTDGYTTKSGNMYFCTSSETLCSDASFLLRSLGCRVTVSIKNSPTYARSNKQHTGHKAYSLLIKCPEGLRIGTSAKHSKRLEQNSSKPVSSRWWRSIVGIEPCGVEECRCIMVDSDEHTYLTNDLICTHNTTTAFLIAAAFQREEMKNNPDNPRSILLLDNEGTADPVWAKKLGYDMGDPNVQTISIRPEAQSAEQIFDIAIDLLKTGTVGLMIFDSLATLVPQQIFDESQEKKQMGGIASSLTRFANSIIGLLRKYKATFVGINQVRENLSGYGDFLLTPGGRAWKHACSMRLSFKRGDFFDEDGNILTKSAQSPAGNIVEVYVLKTKTCKWDRKLGYYHLNYDKGVDIIADTIDVATHFGFIDNSVQGSFKFINPDTGEPICNEDGEPVKIRGKKNVAQYLKDNVSVWRNLYDKCYEKLKQKEDPNIVAFEKMLDIDVYEKLGVSKETNLEEF